MKPCEPLQYRIVLLKAHSAALVDDTGSTMSHAQDYLTPMVDCWAHYEVDFTPNIQTGEAPKYPMAVAVPE
jgi:hypothetical protein